MSLCVFRDIRLVTVNHVRKENLSIRTADSARAVIQKHFNAVQENVAASRLRKSASAEAASALVDKAACDHVTSSFSMANGDTALSYNLEQFMNHQVHTAGVAAGSMNCLAAYGVDETLPEFQSSTCALKLQQHFSPFKNEKSCITALPVNVCGTTLSDSHSTHLQSSDETIKMDAQSHPEGEETSN